MLITSRSVLEEVIDNLGLDMGYGALKGNVSINNPDETRILQITVTNPDPQLAKELADELAAPANKVVFILDPLKVSQ